MEFAEGAKLVGAERLTIRLAALAQAQAKGNPDSTDLWALREELEAVLDALAAAEGTTPEPSVSEKSAPAEPTKS
jgi:tape measure domain-containing protein